jgi:hypothetical protein
MDKYTKFILTMIAVGILGLNYHLFKGEIITSAFADVDENKVYKIALCNPESTRVHACVEILDRKLTIYDGS